MKNIKKISIVVIMVLLISMLVPLTNVHAAATQITFEDKVLAATVQAALEGSTLSADGLTLSTTDEAIQTLTVIAHENTSTTEDTQKITDLTGIEKLTSLQTLKIKYNNVADLTPLENLTTLKALSIGANKISDLTPIDGLTNLTTLAIGLNNISDITALKNLTSLTTLSAAGNKIQDLTPLKDLIALTVIDLANNNVKSLDGLQNLGLLQRLSLSNGNLYVHSEVKNQITDLTPIKDLTNLTVLRVSNETAHDRGDTGTYLGNAVSDVTPLANLTGLVVGDNFDIVGNKFVKDIVLEKNETEKVIDLPQIFVAAKTEGNLLYTTEALVLENATLSADGTKITIAKPTEETGTATVKIVGGEADATNITYNISIKAEEPAEEEKKDDSAAKEKYPQTGIDYKVIAIIAGIVIIGVIGYKKFGKYKNLK